MRETVNKDMEGNILAVGVKVRDVRDPHLATDGRLVATVGLEDILKIANSETVLAVVKDKVHEVGDLATALKSAGRLAPLLCPLVYPPRG